MSPVARIVAAQLIGHPRGIQLAVIRSLPVAAYEALAEEALSHRRSRAARPPSPKAHALPPGAGLDEVLYGAVGEVL